MADLVKKLRYRVDPESYEGWLAYQLANWTLDALAETHPTAAELTPDIGVSLALETVERWRKRDYEAVGFRGER